MVDVLSPGADVELLHSAEGHGRLQTRKRITAKIVSVEIFAAGRVLYQVAWWSGGERKTVYVEAHEVIADLSTPIARIGFLTQAGT